MMLQIKASSINLVIALLYEGPKTERAIYSLRAFGFLQETIHEKGKSFGFSKCSDTINHFKQ